MSPMSPHVDMRAKCQLPSDSVNFLTHLLGTRHHAEEVKVALGKEDAGRLAFPSPPPPWASARPAAALHTQVSRQTGERDRETPRPAGPWQPGRILEMESQWPLPRLPYWLGILSRRHLLPSFCRATRLRSSQLAQRLLTGFTCFKWVLVDHFSFCL